MFILVRQGDDDAIVEGLFWTKEAMFKHADAIIEERYEALAPDWIADAEELAETIAGEQAEFRRDYGSGEGGEVSLTGDAGDDWLIWSEVEDPADEPPVVARRPYDDDKPDGCRESDNDFVKNNIKACVAFLERTVKAQA